MATPLSLEAQHLLKQMAHGDWRHKEEMVNALAPSIAPGRALRRFDATAMPPEMRAGTPPTDDEKIRMGQRRLALIVIRSLRRRFLESEHREDGEWLRLRSEPKPLTKSKVFRVADAEPEDELNQCQVCGGYVLTSQQEDHENFHAVNDAPPEDPEPAKAVESTPGYPHDLFVAEIRAAVQEELATLVDGDGIRRAVGQEMQLVLGGRLARQMIRDEVTSIVEQSLGDHQAGLLRFLNTWMDDIEKAIFTSRVTRTRLLGGPTRT